MSAHPAKGFLSAAQLKEKVSSGEIETVLTVFPDMYGRLMGKRIHGEFFVDQVVDKGIHACNYLYTVDMEMDPVPGYEYSNWETGYGDFHCVPDMSTLRVADWLDRSAIVFSDSYEESTDTLTPIAPRTILKKQLENAAASGFSALGASELEYYILDESYSKVRRKGYHNLKYFSSYNEDYHILQGTREEPLNAAARRSLSNSGVPVEFSKGECGDGQHELNIRYAEVLDMADRHSIFKQCLKDIADSLGLSVTFMAKLSAELPGSSCHVHLSLWDRGKGTNLFAGDHKLGPIYGSETFRWFLGGWMAHAPELMLFYAPTVNSYKRYQVGSWAPTGLAWSYDNRTASFRVVGKGSSLRIESRIPGADANPYLMYAASIASGLDGIRNKISPPAMIAGDVYRTQDLPQVPTTMSAAVTALEESTFAREAFGDDVVEHYLHFFRTESASFDKAVTDWEKNRYFERI